LHHKTMSTTPGHTSEPMMLAMNSAFVIGVVVAAASLFDVGRTLAR
jgi:hypothetical protein